MSAAVKVGARVRAREGPIGTVEQLEQQQEGDSEGRNQPNYMIVRATTGERRYRVPMSRVTRVTRRGEQTVVHTDLDRRALARYTLKEPEGVAATKPREVEAVQVAQAAPGASAEASGEVLRIPLATEQLVARTQPVPLGNVHIHKGVETVEHRVTVPVRHEQVILEHIPPDQYDGQPPANPDEIIIPVMEERLVVQKQTVVREYLRLRKEQVEEPREVAGTLRREYVDITRVREDGTSAGPALHYAAGDESGTTPSHVADA
jgi:uncharacterized protein (TIGR02271 family)